MVEAEQPLELPESVEEPREISVATVDELPADDDVLATLLGMWNYSLAVVTRFASAMYDTLIG